MIAGISIAAVVGVLLLTVCIYIGFYRKRKVKEASLLPTEEHSLQPGHGTCFLFVSPFLPPLFVCLFVCLVVSVNEQVLHGYAWAIMPFKLLF